MPQRTRVRQLITELSKAIADEVAAEVQVMVEERLHKQVKSDPSLLAGAARRNGALAPALARREKLLRAFQCSKQPLSVAQVKLPRVSEAQTFADIQTLVRKKLVKRVGKGRYAITSLGSQQN
jgi:hypothetical protein